MLRGASCLMGGATQPGCVSDRSIAPKYLIRAQPLTKNGAMSCKVRLDVDRWCYCPRWMPRTVGQAAAILRTVSGDTLMGRLDRSSTDMPFTR